MFMDWIKTWKMHRVRQVENLVPNHCPNGNNKLYHSAVLRPGIQEFDATKNIILFIITVSRLALQSTEHFVLRV